VMVRVCVCTPPPHALLHADHPLHSEIPQSIGHACVLHAWFWLKAGHAVPPLAAAVTTVRVWVCDPPPQRVEQADHVDHSLTTQLTAQGIVLQCCFCSNSGQALPPF
jgi:hypothetical protein